MGRLLDASEWRQDRVWTDAASVEHAISDMEYRYLRNVLRFCRRRALWLHMHDCFSIGMYLERAPDGAAMCAEAELWQMEQMGPIRYMNRTPLMRALISAAWHKRCGRG